MTLFCDADERKIMTSKQRLDSYISGGEVDRRPNLTIVGSVVTQYTGITVEKYCRDATAMAQSAIEAARDLGLDYVQIASDLAREAEGYGSILNFYDDKLPNVKKYALDDISDVSSLKPLKAKDIRRVYELVEATAYAIEHEKDVYPMTLAVGPATVAGNIRGIEDLLVDCLDDEDASAELLNIATETTVDFIRELAAVGAKYVYVADPVASLLSPANYESLVLPCHKRIFGEMERLGIGSRLHMCGNTTKLLPLTTESGAKIIDVDHAVDFAAAVRDFGSKAILNGNIDPVADVYSCDAAHTEKAILDVAASVQGMRAMFMPGCELPTLTPLTNVRAISTALKKIGG